MRSTKRSSGIGSPKCMKRPPPHIPKAVLVNCIGIKNRVARPYHSCAPDHKPNVVGPAFIVLCQMHELLSRDDARLARLRGLPPRQPSALGDCRRLDHAGWGRVLLLG